MEQQCIDHVRGCWKTQISVSNIIMCFKYDKTEIVPAADFLEPLNNSIKVWSFLWVIIPAIHHQINILWLYLNARNVGAKWRVLMHNHPVNDFCVKENCSVTLCRVVV